MINLAPQKQLSGKIDGLLSEFIRMLFGMEEEEDVPTIALWVVGGFLLFLVYVFAGLK
jgi:hypothetical protein